MTTAMKQVPTEVLAELANEFAAGLPARTAVMREAVDEIARRRSVEAAHRLRLSAHALAGTASAFGATELVPHAERLEALGKEWQERNGAATRASVAVARRAIQLLAASLDAVIDRQRLR
ncbi:MAG TPA: Hpt domain-containing protein [Gemmatimonadaceae bacterium]|jgi:HPt (histidine-containing phosphotransfer) domain-containing protein